MYSAILRISKTVEDGITLNFDSIGVTNVRTRNYRKMRKLLKEMKNWDEK